MRRPRKAGGLLIALCAAMTTGCLFQGGESRSAGWLDRIRGQANAPPDGLVLRTVLIERPAGDPYLNNELWVAAGQPVPHELSALLARNGLRVGLLSGMVPGEFDRLVTSESATVSPMLRTARPGQPKVIPVNGPLDRCAYQAIHDLAASPAPVELTGAECGVSVTAYPADGGRVRLVCEPQVQHGERQGWLKPTADGTGFLRRDAKPLEAYPTLAWDVTIGPNDYLVVGAASDPSERLGQAFFFNTDENRVRQRVLVIRASRTPTAAEMGRLSATPTPAALTVR